MVGLFGMIGWLLLVDRFVRFSWKVLVVGFLMMVLLIICVMICVDGDFVVSDRLLFVVWMLFGICVVLLWMFY